MGLMDKSATYLPDVARLMQGVPAQAWQKSAADGAAATATAETPIGQCGAACTISAIRIVPQAALTGDNANNATILIQKRTGAGGPTTVATITTTVANGNWVAFVPVNIPLTTANVLAGDVLTVTISKGGTGVVVPALQLEIFQA